MIDSLIDLSSNINSSKILQNLNLKIKDYVVVTLHRPSNVDSLDNLEKILLELEKLSQKVKVVFPVHPRIIDKVNTIINKWLKKSSILISQPLPYFDFIKLVKNSNLVITDSGGIQEETSFFGVPCLTLRNNTERPITVEEGTNKLIGSNPNAIIRQYEEMNNKSQKQSIKIELWEGKASDRIVEKIKILYKLK